MIGYVSTSKTSGYITIRMTGSQSIKRCFSTNVSINMDQEKTSTDWNLYPYFIIIKD